MAGSFLVPACFAAEQSAPTKEQIPFRRDAEAVDSGLALRVALALGLVVALGIGGVYALKRFMPASLGGSGGTAGRINVLEVRRVTPRLTLFLVEIDGEKFALVQSGDRVRPITLRPRS
jgi:flagellar biogenesis protein FliO